MVANDDGIRGNRGDRSDRDAEVVRLLNADLYGEHDAILYYLTHAWTVARQHGPQILEIANDEMRHFKWLAHTIVALDGVPDMSPPVVRPVPDLQAALRKDVDAEVQAIDQYEAHADRIDIGKVRSLLHRIVADERDHLRQFQELLDRTHGEPGAVERPEREVAPAADRLYRALALEYQQTLAYLLQSFLEDHSRRMGLDLEERSVDEMRHMGWIGKQLGALGLDPSFPVPDSMDGRAGEAAEVAMYRDVRRWATDAMPDLVPTIDRILAHERYHIDA